MMNTFSFSSSVICCFLFQCNKHFYFANLSCIWILQVFSLYALICVWIRDYTIALDGQKDSLAHVIWSICYCCRHSLTAVWWLNFYFWIDVIVSAISLLTIFLWQIARINLIFIKEGHCQGCSLEITPLWEFSFTVISERILPSSILFLSLL